MKNGRLSFFLFILLVTAGTGPLHLTLHLMEAKAEGAGRHDPHKCPECQILSNLRAVDPPEGVDGALYVLEPAGSSPFLQEESCSDTDVVLPYIRSPPSFPL